MKIKYVLWGHGPIIQACNNGACPGAHITEDGHAIIQGYELTEAEKSAVPLTPGEGFVKMPLKTLKRIAAQVMIE
ncbi:MAG: hypothetical protein JNN07_21600 [Verrucomicrobiales bacterium]|nr:hypothetical protein [Verrucomicrobiales bacterium]